jgi:hypothetical protein
VWEQVAASALISPLLRSALLLLLRWLSQSE